LRTLILLIFSGASAFTPLVRKLLNKLNCNTFA
jgi:hypothetical protein